MGLQPFFYVVKQAVETDSDNPIVVVSPRFEFVSKFLVFPCKLNVFHIGGHNPAAIERRRFSSMLMKYLALHRWPPSPGN